MKFAQHLLQPYKSFGMVCAKQQCTNHAKPSLRSGADLKVKPMLGSLDNRENYLWVA